MGIKVACKKGVAIDEVKERRPYFKGDGGIDWAVTGPE
jgi:hypothetical protein